MAGAFFFNALFFYFYRIIFRKPGALHRNASIGGRSTSLRTYNRYPSLVNRSDLSNHTLIFNVEGALLNQGSFVFPYFMLVAFEAGSLLRVLVLFLLYPLVNLAGEDLGLKIMVLVCFFGIKRDSFRAGSSVLPKFFLEDVGSEMFEVVTRGGKKVAVSDLPQVMVEGFLKDYLEIDMVLGRKLKAFGGYFLGLMEDRKRDILTSEEVQGDSSASCNVIGITGCHKSFDPRLSLCKEIYLVNEVEKKRWQKLPRERYPKPLIFHDGRLALRPTPLDTLALFTWLPLGFIVAIIRMVVSISLPFNISIPINAFTGMHLTVSKPAGATADPISPYLPDKRKGVLYVCNHRTLLDPLYVSFILRGNPSAVTYSLSRMSEILSPMKTVRLTRNRDRDEKIMRSLLSQGDLVVCPEGTTCRESFLLRFSPLFSEVTDEVVPVATDSHASMFHGTTAGGIKCLDPVFFLMNPSPTYTVRLLEKVTWSSTSRDANGSRFEVANQVQSLIAEALKFRCTKLTRRDKYLILAGNEGVTGAAHMERPLKT